MPLIRSSYMEQLHTRGWGHLEAIMLAALALKSSLLMIGPHGTNKTRFVQTMAELIGLKFTALNAANINYDDMVGLPLPDENKKTLHYIPTPSSLWHTEYLFVDEVNRANLSIQGRLFPVIHERTLSGIRLVKLQHCWGAMNPSAPDELDFTKSSSNFYIGTESLDPAFRDRWHIFVNVPDWRQLSIEDRQHVIYPEMSTIDPEFSIIELITECEELIPEVRMNFQPEITGYVLCVMDLLARSELPQSPRRAHIMGHTLAGIHAARLVLEEGEIDFERSCELALIHSVPEIASEEPPTELLLRSIHQQAYALSMYLDDERWWKVYLEPDAVMRVYLALKLNIDPSDIGELVTQALEEQPDDVSRLSAAVALYLLLAESPIPPFVAETLTLIARPCLAPRIINSPPGESPPVQDIAYLTLTRDHSEKHRVLEYNFLLSAWEQRILKAGDFENALKALRKRLAQLNIA